MTPECDCLWYSHLRWSTIGHIFKKMSFFVTFQYSNMRGKRPSNFILWMDWYVVFQKGILKGISLLACVSISVTPKQSRSWVWQFVWVFTPQCIALPLGVECFPINLIQKYYNCQIWPNRTQSKVYHGQVNSLHFGSGQFTWLTKYSLQF